MKEDSAKMKRKSVQKSMTLSKISKAWMEERDWEAVYGKGSAEEHLGNENQGSVIFALRWLFSVQQLPRCATLFWLRL